MTKPQRYLGDNRVIEAYRNRKVRLSSHGESDAVQLTLSKVLYVPDLSNILLSFCFCYMTQWELKFYLMMENVSSEKMEEKLLLGV